ncbi:MAG: family 20 glycosylhydrolase, partial [Merdibacter sp.]|nr:family 20 glycosylhydrolase [Merdibacter sp.]
IQVSDDGSDWRTVKEINDRPASTTDRIILDNTESARYVRLYIDSFTAENPDGDVTWNTISLFEMEVYGGEIQESASDIANQIEIADPQLGDETLNVSYPETDRYTIEYKGTDYEQVVDENRHIYTPIVDTVVNVAFKITDNETGEYEFKEIGITIPGTYTQEEGDNAAPDILPELREWKGSTGNFTVSDSSRIIYADEGLQAAAEEMAADYKDLTGKDITVMQGTSEDVQAGDFYFALTDDTSMGLMEEGYLMNVEDAITVTAETQTGAYWATRTILQGLKLNNFETFPKGITRDYPLYEIRGYIMDVARRPFTMDFLEQVVKEMSWYKMNDFQVHINDNLIPLESVSDPMSAYSAFRLESSIKEGDTLTDSDGNPVTLNGENLVYHQDLTSTDLFYTKDEFRDFIQESRELGVNIVPEIDTPAHSLALTKVLPELRQGTSGRQNDHLNLIGESYNASLAFVQEIFSEYLDGSDPVFDAQTIVHIGADEYNASSQAYRMFVNDMLEYVEGTGRKARVWGSFTQAAQGEDINAEGVEINLWNFGYANMDEMYDDGFDLINCNDGNYYIVPNAGYYYDYLPDSTMYNLAINTISGVTIPAGDPQMKGGAFAVWNDMTDYLYNGVSEYDIWDRISNLPLFAAKLWGRGDMDLTQAQAASDALGEAPRTNFGYEVDSVSDEYINMPMDTLDDTSDNDFTVNEGENASIVEVDGKNALQLNGGTSYITTGLETAGLGNDLRVKVKRTSDSTDDQILFESPYGSIKAVQGDTGKVGFTRELYDYSFNYTLPVNEWVELEFKNQQNVIELYVNGSLVDTLGDDEQIQGRPMRATCMFPMAKVGSETDAFVGYVDDVRLGVNDDFASTMALDYAVETANAVMDAESSDVLQPLIDQAKELFTQYAPDAAAIESLTAQINDVLAGMDYEKADYSRVNAYLDLIDDLSVFTDATVKTLEMAVEAVRENLPASMQATVDAYEAAIVNALDGLELKELSNTNYVDSSMLEATASSYQHDGSDPENVLDDNPSTMWHTDWNVTTMPHWIDLQISEPTVVNGLYYLPRQSGSNGNATSYQVQVKNAEGQYETVAEGTWSSNSSAKEVTFDAVETTNVRLVYVKAVNNNGSAAEIKLMLANVEPDVEGLQAAIEKASAVTNNNYTEATWNALQAKIAEAEELAAAEDPDANEVEIMKVELVAATMALRLSDTIVDEEPASDVAIQALRDMVEKAIALGSEDEALNAAIEAAQAVLAEEEPTVTEVVTALLNLSEAMQDLGGSSDVDALRADVQATIDFINENILSNVEGLRPGKVQALKDAVAAAQTLVNDPTATADALKAANKAMTKAAQELWEIVTKAELEALIEAANGYLDGDYTAESLQALQAAITAAQAVANNDDATTAEVTEAITNLSNAIAGLESIRLDKSALEHEIELVSEMVANLDDYIASSVEGLADKLADAQNVLENATTQAEIDEATKTLREARLNARTKADTSALEELIAYAKSLDLSGYTTESAQAVIQNLARAENLITDPEITQEEVNNMVETLQASVDNLVEVNNSTSAEDTTNTAAAMQTGLFAGLLAVSAGLVLMMRRRRTER